MSITAAWTRVIRKPRASGEIGMASSADYWAATTLLSEKSFNRLNQVYKPSPAHLTLQVHYCKIISCRYNYI